ncbi:nucleotide disphospho-sugar-binding domain-containing protein [Thermomonospora cellulosilytica]|uniref:UDP:flavonoid glycosyltransferase YjiC (YdhE family) n=1 Tax=Thermomonospora cellulosilytica TaxID=1411118 RepID=A0A7W3RAA0_9ACTN|nr:nucleotide disphospho-sugar-binding domain-containing protein [Thermomonospora cellulosilytica]MBA9005504.1 UDP:flavonoid glycosyltransferase YjiC (YdhE family) [Thermomonospora cellulosilytica]
MRVLLATWPTPSHYFSMVSPGWALRSAGHDVRIVSPPGAEGAVLRSGLTISITGPRLNPAAAWKGFEMRPGAGVDEAEHERERSARAFSMFAAGAREMVDELVALARSWRPDLVLYEPRMYAALKAARDLGVPAVRVLPGPDYTYTRLADEREQLDELWKELELEDADPLGDLTLDPCPPSLQVDDGGTVSRLGVRNVPYNGSAVVPPWLSERPARPRVFISLGTMVATLLGSMNFVHDTICALAGLDVEVLAGVFSDQRELLGAVPGNVRLVEDMPLHLMLPTVDVAVHHGGSGTLLTTAAHGVPQLVLSSFGDTVLAARQIAGTGAGKALRAWDATPDRVCALVGELLETPSFGEAATRLAEENARRPAPAAIVGALEELAARAPVGAGAG